MTSRPKEITRLLIAWNQSDGRARNALAPIICGNPGRDNLRRDSFGAPSEEVGRSE